MDTRVKRPDSYRLLEGAISVPWENAPHTLDVSSLPSRTWERAARVWTVAWR